MENIQQVIEVRSDYVLRLRTKLKLSQVEFGNLFGVHFMTVSKWERGLLKPTAYQSALMQQFMKTAEKKAGEEDALKNLLVSAGIVAALLWLLSGK